MQNSDSQATTSRGLSENPESSAISLWCWVTTPLLLFAAALLTLCPRLLLFVSETESISDQRRSALTPLESFLALHFGIWLAAIGAAIILNVPPSSTDIPDSRRYGSSSYHPLLGPLSVASGVTAFLSYNTRNVGGLSWVFFIGSTTVSLWGFWTVVFGSSSLVSKKTGADMRTSSFLFGNKSAASVQRKRWLQEQKGQKSTR